MADVANNEPQIEHISRFQSLQAGQYWRAIAAIHEEGIDPGEVLLIQSIKWVDDAPHTLILRPHPDKIGQKAELQIPQEDGSIKTNKWFRFDEHRFLLKDFLELFEFEPDHQRIRNEELRRIQGKIHELQTELVEAQSNPALLASIVDSKLKEQDNGTSGSCSTVPAVRNSSEISAMATGTLADAIGTGITAERVASLKNAANQEHRIATIKSEWIQGKTTEIAQTITAMTPYYQEQAAAALAQTEDVRSYVSKLMKGIESLDLYVGKDVEVETIRKGDSAARDIPLTFVQRKLFIDEEVAVWVDVDERFDYAQSDKFFKALSEHDSLVDQIFPTERCVLVMATTRRDVEYGNAFERAFKNLENKKVFLMVRDGMNLYRVYSPVSSHLGAARLFPLKDDHDRIFRGFDGNQIKFEDVVYTDKLEDHEKHALHYKRFLILVCGLDHRLKLFGDFYDGPQGLDFVSMAFQEAHCRFLHDDDGEGMLPGEKRPSFSDWIEKKNAYLRSGSRVLCNWSELMNPSTAPGACKAEHRPGGRTYVDQRYTPDNEMDVAIAYRDGNSICVDVEVSGYSNSIHARRTFTCKVNLSRMKSSDWDYVDQPFLCLDAVDEKDIRWYIHHRGSRQNHLSYIRFFKRALKHIQEERVQEQDTRARMANALDEGGIASGEAAESIIDGTVIAWRAANRGKPLPQFVNGETPAAWKSLLDQMYMLAGEGKNQVDEIETFARELGYEPLRLVLSGRAKLMVYLAPKAEERDDRLEPHAWVHCVTVERGKTKCNEKSRRWTSLPKSSASETTLHEWDNAEHWANISSVFQTFERKEAVMNYAGQWRTRIKPFLGPMDEATFVEQKNHWIRLRQDYLRHSKYVHNPCLAVPFGVVYYPRSKELRFLCVGMQEPHAILHRLAPDESRRAEIFSSFVAPYGQKHVGKRYFEEAVSGHPAWILMEASIELPERENVFFYSESGLSIRSLSGRKAPDPLLASWFESWVSEEKNRAGAIIYAADALDAEKRLVFDNLLDIKRPDDYDPIEVVEITLYASHDKPLPKHYHWFDMRAPRLGKETWRSDAHGTPEGYGCSSQSRIFATRDEAVAFIVASIGSGKRAMPAIDISDANLPISDGIERWYEVENCAN